MKLSLIVPAYNEERRLPDCLTALRHWLITAPYYLEQPEIIVVVNGCTDNTWQVATQYMLDYPGEIRVISSVKGKGSAIKAGMLAAHGDVRVMVDADLSTPARQLERLVDPLLLPNVDITIATREGPKSRRFNEPWHRHLSGRVFNGIIQTVVTGFKDTQCGFKAFTARAARELFPLCQVTGWAFDVEVLYLARRHGLTIREIDVDWTANTDSRIDLIRDSLRMLRDIQQIKRNQAEGLYEPGKETRETLRVA